jgi:DNA-binding IclR family transcriptional regulator
LLEHLNAERNRLAEELERVDERINTMNSVLGGAPTAVRATRAPGAGAREGTIAAAVLAALAKHGSMHIPELVKRTGYRRQQVYPSLMNLKKQGKVKAQSRGVYGLAGRGSGRAARRAGRSPAGRARPSRPAGESSTAVVKVLKRRGALNKDQIVAATGLSRRQVHACLMSLARGKRIKSGAKGTFRLRKGA